MFATAMPTLDPESMGVHIMDFWSLEIPKDPCFFLYAAEPLIFDATLEGAIFKDCNAFPSSRTTLLVVDQGIQ